MSSQTRDKPVLLPEQLPQPGCRRLLQMLRTKCLWRPYPLDIEPRVAGETAEEVHFPQEGQAGVPKPPRSLLPLFTEVEIAAEGTS